MLERVASRARARDCRVSIPRCNRLPDSWIARVCDIMLVTGLGTCSYSCRPLAPPFMLNPRITLTTIAFAFLLSTGTRANEIEFHTPAWNDLSIPLGITSFYLDVNSKLTARDVLIEVEVYNHGKLRRTITSTETMVMKESPAQPLNLKCALYFIPKDENYTGKIVFSWHGGMGTGDLSVPKTDLNFDKGMAPAAFSSELKDSPRTPVFQVVTGISHMSVGAGSSPEGLVAANPDAVVLIGYLIKK
jgi:hypothetical protein